MEIQSPGYHFWTSYQPDGDIARVTGYFERQQRDALLARNTEFSLRFFSRGGPVSIGTQAFAHRSQPALARLTDPPSSPEPGMASRTVTSNRIGLGGSFRHPWEVWEDPPLPVGPVEPPQPPAGGGGGVQHAAVTVRLFAPGMTDPVQTWEVQAGLGPQIRMLEYNPPGFPMPDAPITRAGWWRCSVTSIGPEPVMIKLAAQATLALQPFRVQTIGTRLFNSIFRVGLEAIVPDAHIEGSTLKISLGKELAEAYGLTPVYVEKNLPFSISSQARLRSLNITAVSGRVLKEVADQKGRHPLGLAQVEDDDVAVRIQAAFDKGTASAFGFDVGRLKGDLGELFLVFDKGISRCTPVAFFDVDFSSAADFLMPIIAFFSEVDHDIVNTSIEDALLDSEINGALCKYLREALSRAVAQHAVVHEVSFASESWQLRYFNEPVLSDESLPWHPPHGGLAGGSLHPVDGPAATLELPSDPGAPEEDPGGGAPLPPPTDPTGVSPEGFVVTLGAALERLDKHQSIVVVMMENRSYDHLLGGLASARPRPNGGYDGPPANASNPSADGFLGRVPLVKTTAVAMGTVTPVCPHHDYEPVRFQIGDGTADTRDTGGMQGFTRNVTDRTDSPQIVMMQYQESQLPTYYKLADEFLVCSRWFSAHPGPTWPNRYAMVMGSVPELDNLASDDPRIGFLGGHTIYDALSSAGVDWRVFESDLSLIRTFDRYRLDDRHVVPIGDPTDGLEAVLRSPLPLPRVMFIEPNFTDLPPLATACDDLAPADLAHGQAFIARICDWIWSSGRFGQCLLVVTYDEHGGFYDHVPPPGTAKAAPALIAQLHPEGPKHLGVRVPAFIVSPFVNAGSINTTVFDHTSILKTILVHNRARFPSSVLGSFGPRVGAAEHLGVVLELDAPRQAPEPFATTHASPPSPALTSVAHGGAAGDAGPLPRKITIVPRNGSEGVEPSDPGDFHAALRGVFKPRR
jgi:phospholipase C